MRFRATNFVIELQTLSVPLQASQAALMRKRELLWARYLCRGTLDFLRLAF